MTLILLHIVSFLRMFSLSIELQQLSHPLWLKQQLQKSPIREANREKVVRNEFALTPTYMYWLPAVCAFI